MKRALLPVTGILAALALFGVSKHLVDLHIDALHDVRGTILPVAAELPPLEQRLQILRKQVELSQLQSELRSGTAEEKLRAYVLPQGSDLTRLVAFFDVMHGALSKRKVLQSFSGVSVADPLPFTLPLARVSSGIRSEPLQAQRISFTATVNAQGLSQLQSLLQVSGLITVGDALSSEDIQKLFAITEAQNYSGIVPVEQFLSADLLEYIRDPTVSDRRLTQAFPSEDFLRQFHDLLNSSGLSAVRDALSGGFADELDKQKLWPLPFLILQSIGVVEKKVEWIQVTVSADAISRAPTE